MFAHFNLGVTVMSIAALATGCSSSSDGAFAEFEGRWTLTADTSKANDFRLTCPSLSFDENTFSLFTDLTLERGTLSDLIDTAGVAACRFPYDIVAGQKALSLVNPDPFTGMPTSCQVDLGNSQDPNTLDTIDTLVVLKPAAWVFNLQPAPKGKAPAAQLVGHALVDIIDIDTSVTPTKIVRTSACTYDILENLDRLSKP